MAWRVPRARAAGLAAIIAAGFMSEALAQQPAPPAGYPPPPPNYPYPPPPPAGIPPGPPPTAPPVLVPPPPPIFIRPAFYLRGDAGGAFSVRSSFRDTSFANGALGPGARLRGDSGDAPIYDVGAGARFLPWFRVDVTGSYLQALHFSGHDNAGLGTANTAKIRSWVALVNFYVDFPVNTVVGRLEPYLDFGLGGASNHIGAMNSGFIGGSFAAHTTSSVAASIGGGIGIPLTRNLTLDLAYKFIDLGEVRTGAVTSATVAGVGTAPIKADLAVHTLTAGLRLGF